MAHHHDAGREVDRDAVDSLSVEAASQGVEDYWKVRLGLTMKSCRKHPSQVMKNKSETIRGARGGQWMAQLGYLVSAGLRRLLEDLGCA